MTTSNSRRNLLIAAGAGAAAIGAGLAWRHQQGSAAPASSAAATSTPAQLSPEAAATAAFWNARFEKLDGGELAASGLRGKPLLLNFWASWCAPCVKELPEIAQFQHETQDWQVLGLAVDTPDPVKAFLKKTPLDFSLAMAGVKGTELARSLGNSQGGLPFSVAFNANGDVIWRKLGATSLEELRELAKQKG